LIMVTTDRASAESLLRRWKKKIASDEKLNIEVHGNALRLLSGIRSFVEERQRQLVEDVVVDAALVEVLIERPAYIM
jgi:hypothetical protein